MHRLLFATVAVFTTIALLSSVAAARAADPSPHAVNTQEIGRAHV